MHPIVSIWIGYEIVLYTWPERGARMGRPYSPHKQTMKMWYVSFYKFQFFSGGGCKGQHIPRLVLHMGIYSKMWYTSLHVQGRLKGGKKGKRKKTREEQKQCCKSFITNEILCLWRPGLGRAKLKGGVFMGLMGMVLCLLIFWKCASAIFHSET